jgi:hypothetical protein
MEMGRLVLTGGVVHPDDNPLEHAVGGHSALLALHDRPEEAPLQRAGQERGFPITVHPCSSLV